MQLADFTFRPRSSRKSGNNFNKRQFSETPEISTATDKKLTILFIQPLRQTICILLCTVQQTTTYSVAYLRGLTSRSHTPSELTKKSV